MSHDFCQENLKDLLTARTPLVKQLLQRWFENKILDNMSNVTTSDLLLISEDIHPNMPGRFLEIATCFHTGTGCFELNEPSELWLEINIGETLNHRYENRELVEFNGRFTIYDLNKSADVLYAAYDKYLEILDELRRHCASKK